MKKRLVLIGLGLAIVLPVFLLSISVSAEAPKGLTLSPLRSEINIAPGISDGGNLTVTNKSIQPMKVSFSAEEFNVIDQQYDYAFNTKSPLVSWVRFETGQINLLPGATQTVKYTLAVPIDAEPGGRYISLFASNDSDESDSGISSRQRIASLIYLTVAGNVTRQGHLLSLNSPLITGSSASWSATLQNTGTTHFRSRYTVSTRTLFNTEVSSVAGDALILPGSIRLLIGDLQLPNYPGIYKVIYTIGLGDTPAVITTKYEIYLPITLFIGIALVVLMALLIRTFTKARRRKI